MSGRSKALTRLLGVMLIGGSALLPRAAAAQSASDTCLEASGNAAIAACNAAIKASPRDPELYQARGSEYGRKGDNDRAIADYNEAIKLNPDYAMAYFNRGVVLENKRQLPQALADFKRAAELDPSDEDSLKAVFRVTATMKAGPAAAASTPATAATAPAASAAPPTRTAISPKTAPARTASTALPSRNAPTPLGTNAAPPVVTAQNPMEACLEASGEAAIAACNEAIKANPKDPELYQARGSEYGRKGDNDRAIADYNEAIKINPEYAMAYYNRGLILETKRQIPQALADFKRSAELDPSDENSLKAVNRLSGAPATGAPVVAAAPVPSSTASAPAAAAASATPGAAGTANAPSRLSVSSAAIAKWFSDMRSSSGSTSPATASAPAPAAKSEGGILSSIWSRKSDTAPSKPPTNQTMMETYDHWNDQMARANGGSAANQRLNALERLGDLRNSGILTPQEYEREKQRVMGDER